MIWFALALACGFIAGAILVRTAPDGWEDADGFHLNPSHDLSHNQPESLRGVSCVPHSDRSNAEVQQNPDAR